MGFVFFWAHHIIKMNTQSETDDVWHEYNLLRQSSSEIERAFAKLREERKEISSKLRKTREKLMMICDHSWIREPLMYQERTWYKCSKCGNMK